DKVRFIQVFQVQLCALSYSHPGYDYFPSSHINSAGATITTSSEQQPVYFIDHAPFQLYYSQNNQAAGYSARRHWIFDAPTSDKSILEQFLRTADKRKLCHNYNLVQAKHIFTTYLEYENGGNSEIIGSVSWETCHYYYTVSE